MLKTLLPIAVKFFRFVLVGVSGLIVDFGLTYLFKEKWKVNKYIANGVGFFSAATSNFFLNRSWTFASVDPDVGSQYAKFILFSLVGLLINSVIVWLLNDRLKKNFYLSKAAATIIVTLWNFLSNFLFTFR
ncbi:MAG: GtrA family protein [Cyclobacteriaceae bacterium]|nr:GtrA family protein [Cyclobacteriaceae bacterium]